MAGLPQSNNPGVFIHDSADRTPPQPAGRHPHAMLAGSDWRAPATRLSNQAWLAIIVVASIIVIVIMVALTRAVQSYVERYPEIADAVALLTILCVVALLVAAVLGVLQFGQIALANMRVIRTRLGSPIDVRTIMGLDPLALDRPQLTLETHRAQFSEFPNLSTMGGSSTSAPAAQLATPAASVDLVPIETWIDWLSDAPHLLVAGETNAGKTTIAMAALRQELVDGASVLVIDPKGKDWFGLPSVGAGRDFESMLSMLARVSAEMDRRYKEYGQGRRDFDRVVILVDEVPDLQDSCKNNKGTIIDGRWSTFVRGLGSMAREVSMRVILITQSPLVEDLGMNSAMRGNYTRIALREKIPQLINEDVDTKRRELLRAQYAGLEYPAALLRRGRVELLDTSRVVTVSQRRPATIKSWEPPRLAEPVATDALDSDIVERLRRLRASGVSRDEARQRGLVFTNDLWTAAGGE